MISPDKVLKRLEDALEPLNSIAASLHELNTKLDKLVGVKAHSEVPKLLEKAETWSAAIDAMVKGGSMKGAGEAKRQVDNFKKAAESIEAALRATAADEKGGGNES